MIRHWSVLALLMTGAGWGQAPAFSAANIVNASDYSSGPFAPNSVLSIFGTNLSWYTQALTSGDIAGNILPTQLQNVQVYVDNWPAPLLYVSGSQVNFIVPGNEISGSIAVRVVREGVTSPEVNLTLAGAAPALFAQSTGYALAEHADGSLITASSPAQAGDTVVVYATGLGQTQPNPSPGEIPQTAASIVSLGSLVVYLDNTAVDSGLIKYAGVTPFSVGLYQINIQLPGTLLSDPEIRVAVGGQSSIAGLKINVQ
jgi:uncharacterized protein (TIGR03437 family)